MTILHIDIKHNYVHDVLDKYFHVLNYVIQSVSQSTMFSHSVIIAP